VEADPDWDGVQMLIVCIESRVPEIHKDRGRVNCPAGLECVQGLRGFHENNHKPASREVKDVGRVCGCSPI
jgi:hypothetical protein